MKQQKPLFLETGLAWLSAKAREYKIPLLASLLFGFLAYGFNLTNKLVNHDEVAMLFSKGGSAVLGRWGLDILERIFPNVSMPWIYGLITLGLMAVSVCMICHLFRIRSHLLQILLAGSILTFSSLTSTMAYTFTSAPYAVSFLLAVWAVLLIKKGGRMSAMLALGAMVFSLGIYQSYISVAASLLVLVLIQELLLESDVRDVLRKGVSYLVFLTASLGIYYVITKLILRYVQVGFGEYASNNIEFSLSAIPEKIIVAYKYFVFIFLDKPHWLIPKALSHYMHWAVVAAIVLMLLIWLAAKKKSVKLSRLLLLAALGGILPLAIGCMYLFTVDTAVHTLVLYSFVALYILAVILADLCLPLPLTGRALCLSRRIAAEVISIALCLILASNIYTANAVSLELHLRYENAYAFYTSLFADIRMMPQFNENSKLAVIGNYDSPGFYEQQLSDESTLTGAKGFSPSDYSKDRFMEYYIGFSIPFATWEEINAVTASEEYLQMPVYPYYGSMKFFDDILVVKLS